MTRYAFDAGTVDIFKAWTRPEIEAVIAEAMSVWEHLLPESSDAKIVIKPNLNNDLHALTGNCTDLRVLGAVIEQLQAKGYANITVADGSNVGVDRREIDSFRRLRIDRMTKRLGVNLINLNTDHGHRVVLHAGAHPYIAKTVLESDFLISIPKVKTHAEAGLSCAMKNWVGIACGQQKRHMHYDLAQNIFAINEVVQPDLIIVDGLIGMEGNGPGDGDPFRLGRIFVSDNTFLNDLVVSRAVDMPWEDIGYMVHAKNAGHFDEVLAEEVAKTVPIIRAIRRAPPRSKLAELAEARSLLWFKKIIRPIVDRPEVAEAAYKMKIVQDVYNMDDDSLRIVGRNGDLCGTCRKCESFCPTKLTVDEIGVKLDDDDCVHCLYCWFVCPEDAIAIEGDANHLTRQIERYRNQIQNL